MSGELNKLKTTIGMISCEKVETLIYRVQMFTFFIIIITQFFYSKRVEMIYMCFKYL